MIPKLKSSLDEDELLDALPERLKRLGERHDDLTVITDIRRKFPVAPSKVIDLMVDVKFQKKVYLLAFEVMSSGMPLYVRNKIVTLNTLIRQSQIDAIPVLAAPFFSEGSRDICIENEVCYFDLIGNVYLKLPNLLIDIVVSETPQFEKRSFRSLFRPQAASVLRTMLNEPKRSWRVNELAEAASVSIGHVSNVRKELVRREWGKATSNGIQVTDPNVVLDSWQQAYEAPKFDRLDMYTTLHGKELLDAFRRVFREQVSTPIAAFALYSAAQWIAPYVRTGTEHLYATDHGAELVMNAIDGSRVTAGSNISVRVLKDANILRDAVEPTPGIVCTSPIQTYLDLSIAGDRGTEAADFLRKQVLSSAL